MEIRDSRDKEWFWLDNEYLNGYAKHLGVYCTAVYISLCRHANNKTQTCFPSMKLIAQENAMSTKTVERATKTLEEWNIVSIHRSRKDDGTQANNIYTLTSKNVWKNKPTDYKSHGNSQEPTDSHDQSRQTVVLHNNTNINKTNISKQSLQVPINELMDLFKEVNPTHDELFKNTTERKSLEYLIERFGVEKIQRTINALPAIVSQPYAPKITKPSELKRDFAKLILFYEQNKNIKNNKRKIV